jgi:Cft2 family RNA processing exonuclease
VQGLDFCNAVVGALRRRSGHVIVPVDTATRVLELLLLLEGHWADKKLQYPIVFLCKTGLSVLSKAKAQLEFLSDKVQQVRASAVRVDVGWLEDSALHRMCEQRVSEQRHRFTCFHVQQYSLCHS